MVDKSQIVAMNGDCPECGHRPGSISFVNNQLRTNCCGVILRVVLKSEDTATERPNGSFREWSIRMSRLNYEAGQPPPSAT